MFNPHIHHHQQHHQQQQQQQQFHQHLRQLQQLFQQQQPPPPPPPQPQPPPGHHVPHHHQTPRALPVPPQTAPPPRMVNLCQATQTTIIAPNPMLQGAILMQQMQGNMRSFGMAGQQFRQFFAAGARSSLLGPVPMGMAMKSPMMGFPAARPYHPHARYYNNAPSAAPSASSSSSSSDSAARQPDRKRDSDQLAAGSTSEQPAGAAANSADASDKTDGAVAGEDVPIEIPDEDQDGPAVKKQRTDGEVQSNVDADGETTGAAAIVQSEDFLLEDGGVAAVTDDHDDGGTAEETRADEISSVRLGDDDDPQTAVVAVAVLPADESPLASPENQDEDGGGGGGEDANKFYCYLCSITCHNQHNFRSHMNSVSHQQRMMEIQHMSNACLVTLLPRVQESLQGEKKSESKRLCPTCHTHFSGSAAAHRRTMEHKLASSTNISSCAVCKKHLKTPQAFLEHLQSQEHKRKLQEKGCEALSKLADLDTEGFSPEEDEAGSDAEGDGGQGGRREVWSSLKEVTLDDMASDEQHDPDTAYGSSFLVPVAGFICGLCDKFYHFESSALQTHCKSLQHFENLKRHRALVGQKDDDAAASPEASADCLAESLADDTAADDMAADDTALDDTAADDMAADATAVDDTAAEDMAADATALDDTAAADAALDDTAAEDMAADATALDDTAADDMAADATAADDTDADALEASDTLDPLETLTQEEEQEEEKEEEDAPPSQDDTYRDLSLLEEVEEMFSREAPARGEQVPFLEDLAEEPEDESESAAAAAAATAVLEDEEEEEKEAAPPAATGKRSAAGKAKAAPKRRSGRAANRR